MLVLRCLINCKEMDQWDSPVVSHNVKRENFAARLLPKEEIFKLEKVGVESPWGFQRTWEVTNCVAKKPVRVRREHVCAAKAWARLTPRKIMEVLKKTLQILKNILHQVQFERWTTAMGWVVGLLWHYSHPGSRGNEWLIYLAKLYLKRSELHHHRNDQKQNYH